MTVTSMAYEREKSDRLVTINLSMKMKITKKSKRLGRPVDFGDQKGFVMEQLEHDPATSDQFIIQRSSQRGTQFSKFAYISHVRIRRL